MFFAKFCYNQPRGLREEVQNAKSDRQTDGRTTEL